MKHNAREALGKMGSERAKNLGWRDMWAMVTRKGDSSLKIPIKALAEQYSKSTEFHSWGAPVSLKVQVPLTSLHGKMLILLHHSLYQSHSHVINTCIYDKKAKVALASKRA